MWQTKGWPARSAAGERRCGALQHIGASLMADEFDMSFFMNKKARPRPVLRACCRGSRTRDGRRG
ncbi:hypothetical protein DMH17_00505 [Raoultella planticola]|nr:hypothetical protein [Raoultella planticola]